MGEGREASHSPRPSTIFVNTDADEDHNIQPQSQPLKRFIVPSKPDRAILGPKTKGEADKILRCAAVAFTDGDIFKAQKFYLKLALARSAWLAKHDRTLPTEAQLDWERYGRPRRKESANG